MSPAAIRDVIAEIRCLTTKPFAMNLWVSMEDEGARTSDENAFNRSLASLAAHFAALGAPRPVYKPYSPTRFEDQARVLLDAQVPAFSFICGIPPREILDECRMKGIVTIGVARFSGRRHRRCARNRRWRYRRRPGRDRRFRPWRRGLSNGYGIPGLRRIRRQPTSSRSFARQKSRTYRPDTGLYGKTCTRSPQPLDGRVGPTGNGDFAVSAATRACPKPLDPGRSSGPSRSSTSVGWAKRQAFGLHRRIGFLDLTA